MAHTLVRDIDHMASVTNLQISECEREFQQILQDIVEIEMNSKYHNVQVQIIEQPTPNKHRFRYKNESRGGAAGSLTGASSNQRTYPTIKILGYKGPAKVLVSCVTDEEPYKVHPHKLVGKSCPNGFRVQNINTDDMTAEFTHMGIQCVTRAMVAESLAQRKEFKVDPFNQGFSYASDQRLNLNQLRLCFQVALLPAKNQEFWIKPVVSDIIYNSTSKRDLIIRDLSDNCASVLGHKKIILLCEKLKSRSDIVICFSYQDKNNETQILKGNFSPKDIHRQCAISFRTPPFPDQQITENIPAKMYLFNNTDSSKSNEIDFIFEPLVKQHKFEQPAPVTPRAGFLKRNKSDVRASNNQEEESSSSRLAKPAQKKNANAANRGGKMVIKPFANNGTTNAGYIDTFIKTGSFDSLANGRSGTISQQEDLKAMTTNGQSSSEIVDIPLNQIPSDPEKVLENFDPVIWDELKLSDSMQRTGIHENKSRSELNSQLDTPPVPEVE